MLLNNVLCQAGILQPRKCAVNGCEKIRLRKNTQSEGRSQACPGARGAYNESEEESSISGTSGTADKGGIMDGQDLMRIVRGMLLSVIDLVDSNRDVTEIPNVLTNVRDGAVGFCSMLDSVINDEEGLEDISDNPQDSKP